MKKVHVINKNGHICVRFNSLIKRNEEDDVFWLYELYFALYETINFKKLTPLQTLDIQIIVFWVLELLKNAKCATKEDSIELEDIIYYYRNLVNNVLNRYILDLEIYDMGKLTTSSDMYSGYEAKNMYQYISYIYDYYRDEGEKHIVITDLCVGNIQAGDLILKEDGHV